MAATQEMPKLNVAGRTKLGTRETRRLRESGRLPGVIYGHKQDPVHVTADARELQDILHGHGHLLEVNLDGKIEACLVKDVQWDHLGRSVIHIDFARVDLNEVVTVDVDLEFVGEAVGLKETGAIFEHPVTTLQVQCKASEIPDNIRVDVTKLGAGDSLTVGDIVLPEGVSTDAEPDTVIATVHVLAEEVIEAPETDEAAEPEVIGKKDDDEGEDEDEK